MSDWFVYMLRCADDSFYTGVAMDLSRRLNEHNNSNQLGAKYTRSRRPVTLVYQESCDNRAHACRREYEIKQLTRREKIAMLCDNP